MLYRQCHRYLVRHLKRNDSILKYNEINQSFILSTNLISTKHCSNTAATSSSNEKWPPKALSSKIDVGFDHGLPVLTLPLPSRKDKCQFLLKPISENVQIFCDNLTKEDKGIDYVAIHNREGVRIAGSTTIEHLLQLKNFTIRINDDYYPVEVPTILSTEDSTSEKLLFESSERISTLDDIKLKISALHSLLQADEYKLQREQILMKRLEDVEQQLKPMDAIKKEIEIACDKRSNQAAWAGFIFMGVQTGILFRLTYFEYSWDTIEPLSYFLNYSAVIATLGYYLLTKQSFEYPIACERVFSKQFYRLAAKKNFDIPLYNELTKLRESLINDLNRIRDPLYQHLPATRLASLESELAKKHLTGISKYNPPPSVKIN